MLVFIHMPKTGGQSVEQWISTNNLSKYVYFNPHHQDCLYRVPSSTYFCVIRNPFSFYVSLYTFYCLHTSRGIQTQGMKNVSKRCGLSLTSLFGNAKNKANFKIFLETLMRPDYFSPDSEEFDIWTMERPGTYRFSPSNNALVRTKGKVSKAILERVYYKDYETNDIGLLSYWFTLLALQRDFSYIQEDKSPEHIHVLKTENLSEGFCDYLKSQGVPISPEMVTRRKNASIRPYPVMDYYDTKLETLVRHKDRYIFKHFYGKSTEE